MTHSNEGVSKVNELDSRHTLLCKHHIIIVKNTIIKNIAMKKLICFLALILLPLFAWAYDVETNGIYFNLKKEDKEAEVTYGDNKYVGNVVIPSSISFERTEYTVTEIGKSAFSHCSDLTSIEIPNTIKTIGKEAFWKCTGLTSLTIPSSVTTIEENAITYCSELTSVIIPDGVTTIEWGTFSNCTKLSSITIPNSVTSIKGRAFHNCSSLTSIYIPDGVTSIENGLFEGCTSITNVEIPESVTSIEDYAFSGCSSLTNIEIPSSVKSIGIYAFRWCGGLTSIKVNPLNTKYDSRDNCNAIIETSSNTLIAGCQNTIIPKDITSIGLSAFWGCKGLTSIEIPNGVKTIGVEAFQECTGLSTVTLPESVRFIDDFAFWNCTGLTTIELSKGLKSIGWGAFFGCSSLASVNIPNSMKTIGPWVFRDCASLKTITIPRNVKNIYPAFEECTGLTSIIIEGTTPAKIDSTVFENVDKKSCFLDVPQGSETAYKNAKYWNEFENIVTHESIGDIEDQEKFLGAGDNPSQFFTLTYDTIQLNAEKYDIFKNSNLSSACKWHGNYYLLIDYPILSVSENLEDIHQIETSDDFIFSELFVRNDSLMATGHSEEKYCIQYYDSLHNKWVPKKEMPREPYKRIKQPIREDETYRIYFTDNGEFGGRLIFLDKETGKDYLYGINNERVIRYLNDYYLICLDRIYMINDPTLNKAELIQMEEGYEYPNYYPCFVSAFCLSDDLYVVANNQEETYIARLKDEDLEYVFGFGRLFDFRNGDDYNLEVNQYDDRVLLKFNSDFIIDKNDIGGIIDIKGRQINVIFIELI